MTTGAEAEAAQAWQAAADRSCECTSDLHELLRGSPFAFAAERIEDGLLELVAIKEVVGVERMMRFPSGWAMYAAFFHAGAHRTFHHR